MILTTRPKDASDTGKRVQLARGPCGARVFARLLLCLFACLVGRSTVHVGSLQNEFNLPPRLSAVRSEFRFGRALEREKTKPSVPLGGLRLKGGRKPASCYLKHLVEIFLTFDGETVRKRVLWFGLLLAGPIGSWYSF